MIVQEWSSFIEVKSNITLVSSLVNWEKSSHPCEINNQRSNKLQIKRRKESRECNRTEKFGVLHDGLAMQRSFVPLLRKSLEKISQQFRPTLAPCILSQNCTLVSLSENSPGGPPRGNGDRLILRGMRFHGKHGVFQEERTLGQKFDVDVDAWMDLSKAVEKDNLEDSVSYSKIYSQIRAIVEGPPHFFAGVCSDCHS